MEPHEFGWRRCILRIGNHQLFPVGNLRLVVLVQVVQAAVGEGQRLGIIAVDVAIVGAVGKRFCFRQCVVGNHHHGGADGGVVLGERHHLMTTKERPDDQQAYDALGQSEIESAAFPFLALHLDGAHLEDLAQFAVFLDDALAVHQSEAVRALCVVGHLLYTTLYDGLVVEDVLLLLVGHSHTCILHADFHVIVGGCGRDLHTSSRGRELAGIVGHRVDHEERKRAVGLYNILRVVDRQLHSPQLEGHAAFLHDVEQLLQTEALDVEAHIALPHLNPFGEDVVVVVDLVGQLGNVCIALGSHLRRVFVLQQPLHLVYHAVDERRDGVDKRYFRTLLQIAPLVVEDVQLRDFYLLVDLLVLLVN